MYRKDDIAIADVRVDTVRNMAEHFLQMLPLCHNNPDINVA